MSILPLYPPSPLCQCVLVGGLIPLYILGGCGPSQIVSCVGQSIYCIKQLFAKDDEKKRFCRFKRWQYRGGMFVGVGAMVMHSRICTSQRDYENDQDV